MADRILRESKDSHLRSSEAVTGYHLEAVDGEIGHVDSFLVDEGVWTIRYLEVATHNWWPGNKVLVSPDWVERVSWPDSKVYVGLSRDLSGTARNTRTPRPSLASMKTGSTFTTAGLPIGWTKSGTRRPFSPAPFKF